MQATSLDQWRSEYELLTASRDRESAEVARSLRRVFDGSMHGWNQIFEAAWKVWIPVNTFKFMGFDLNGRASIVAIVSPKLEPNAVAENVEKAEEARRLLGPLGGAILSPLQVGVLDGLAYAVFPCLRPLRINRRFLSNILRTLVGRRVLPWLRSATERTAQEPTIEELQGRFIAPLEHLCEASSMPAELRASAEAALRRIDTGAWRPRVSFMHDDLNWQNLLISPGIATWNQPIIIDWERFSIRGYGFYDLIGMTKWMKLSTRRLRVELDGHRRILGCDPVDVRGYMLAVLGDKSMALDEPFPTFLAREPDRVAHDDVMASIPGRQRKSVVDVAAAVSRLKQLDSLEAHLHDRR